MPSELESLVVEVAENQRTRTFGKYRGLVEDVDDPLGRGRIRARVPAVFHDHVSPWAMPCVPFAGPDHGLVLLPEVGDGVWIEFEGGDTARPIWSGGWWADDQLPSPGGARVRLWKTTAGHQVVLDEDADEIRLVHPGGAQVVLGSREVTISLGTQQIKISESEINLNNGMVKVTTAGASLVNDALKVGG